MYVVECCLHLNLISKYKSLLRVRAALIDVLTHIWYTSRPLEVVLIACTPKNLIIPRDEIDTTRPRQPYAATTCPSYVLPPTPHPSHEPAKRLGARRNKSCYWPRAAVPIACTAHTTTQPRVQFDARIFGHRARPQPRPVGISYALPSLATAPRLPNLRVFVKNILVTLP